MNLEDELRAAFRREDPSPGFTTRVVARAQSKAALKAPRRPVMIWAAAMAAMLMIGLTTTYEYRQMKAERAAQEAVVALRIAANKLNMTRDKVLGLEN